MKKRSLSYLLLLFSVLILLPCCKESDANEEEFADWRNKNEAYWSQLYSQAQEKMSRGDESWKIIRQWSIPEETDKFHPDINEYIVVHVLESGESGKGSPLYSDVVSVNYVGKLIPSKTYTTGYVFDRSYTGDFNWKTALPTKMNVSGVVDGFSTALQYMNKGDRWEVYIPYKLAYGFEGKTQAGIPGYSTLVFDIALADFYHPNDKPQSAQAKKSAVRIGE